MAGRYASYWNAYFLWVNEYKVFSESQCVVVEQCVNNLHVCKNLSCIYFPPWTLSTRSYNQTWNVIYRFFATVDRLAVKVLRLIPELMPMSPRPFPRWSHLINICMSLLYNTPMLREHSQLTSRALACLSKDVFSLSINSGIVTYTMPVTLSRDTSFCDCFRWLVQTAPSRKCPRAHRKPWIKVIVINLIL